MTTVFIAGSITIKKLDARVRERIDKVVEAGHTIVVGDADGADSAIQDRLFNTCALRVTVYCTGTEPRNNIGSWPTQLVTTNHAAGTRAFFTAKDLEMAKIADFGLMVWDTKSTGTLSNVLELLQRRKKSVVYVNKNKIFKNVGTVEELEALVKCMSDSAKAKADEKMRLTERIQAMKQITMFA